MVVKGMNEQLYLKVMVYHRGEDMGYFTHIDPIGESEDSFTDLVGKFTVVNDFRQVPHLVGSEGKCVHRRLTASVDWMSILAFILSYGTVSCGPSLTELYRVESFSLSNCKDDWLPSELTLYGADEQFEAQIFGSSSSSEEQGEYVSSETYAMAGSTFAYENISKAGSLLRQEKHVAATLMELNGRMAIHSHIYHKIHNSAPGYNYCTKQDGYEEHGAYRIKDTSEWEHNPPCNTFFIAVPAELFRTAANAVRSAIMSDSIGLGLPKFCVPPIEQSLLDDLYNILDRAELNLAATAIELCGSVRNAKNLSSVLQKIHKAGGIRKLLLSEASHLLKDEKLKTASDLYLTKKYLYDTTSMDLDDLVTKLSSRTRRSTTPVQHLSYSSNIAGVGTVKHNFRIAYRQPEQSWAALNGLDLPLEATWDLLPYSFVVDWFTGIGDYIESVEKLQAIHEIDIISVTESVRYERQFVRTIKEKDLLIPYTSSWIYYCREVATSLPPVYPLSPEISNPFHHIIDGAALIFSKGK